MSNNSEKCSICNGMGYIASDWTSDCDDCDNCKSLGRVPKGTKKWLIEKQKFIDIVEEHIQKENRILMDKEIKKWTEAHPKPI